MPTARGQVHSFAFEDDGRLISDFDPAGGSTTLAGNQILERQVVTRRSGEGRQSTHAFERIGDESIERDVTDSAGQTTHSLQTKDGSQSVQTPTTTLDLRRVAHPRFGMLAPDVGNVSYASGSISGFAELGHDLTLVDPSNPLSAVESESMNLFLNGRSYEMTYDGSNRTFTTALPSGRTASTVVDEKGRPIRFTRPGLLLGRSREVTGLCSVEVTGVENALLNRRLISIIHAAGVRAGGGCAGSVQEIKGEKEDVWLPSSAPGACDERCLLD